MKKLKNVFIIVVLLAVVGIGFSLINKGTNGVYGDFDHIATFDVMRKGFNDHDYVYIYNDSKSCKKLEKKIIKFGNKHKNNIFFVNADRKNEKNHVNQFKDYDWVTFHTNNDKEIGKIIDGKIQYYNDESAEKYTKNTEVNDQGKIKRYEVVTADKKYLKENTNAKIGYVYAKLLTPEVNYSLADNSNTIIIAQYPTLISIDHREVTNYIGYQEINEFLKKSS